MKKIVIESPWGNFLELHVLGQIYKRTAIGNLWNRKGGHTVGVMGAMALDTLAARMQTTETVPDRFSAMLRRALPPEKLLWMKPTSTNGL